MGITLDKHQIDAIKKIHNGCVLVGGVGSGKTRTALAYYILKECNGHLRINGKGKNTIAKNPKDLLIITTALMRDSMHWDTEAARFGIGKTKDTTVAGVMTVDSWNNIGKYIDVTDCFVVLDEQRLVGGGAWAKAFIKIAKNNRWIMLSATPGSTWLDYVTLFVANGFYRNRTDFKREHVVYSSYTKYPSVDRYLGVGKLVRLRDLVLVEMPYRNQNVTRFSEDIIVEFDKDKFYQVLKKRWNVYENRPLRDAGEMFRTMRRLVNSDPSRLEAIRDLLEKHSRLIVFYNWNVERDALLTLSEEIPMAEWSGHHHQQIPIGDRWLYIVQYAAGSEGWNCISTNAMCFYSLTYSYKNWHQAHGRIDRLNTPYTELFYYVLKSKSAIDLAIAKALASKKNFNENQFKVKF